MKTLLVLAQHPGLAESIGLALKPEQYKVIHRRNLEDAEPLLIHGLIHASIIDADLTDVQGIWVIEKLKRNLSSSPILLYAESKNWEWEEEAYLHGVAHILTKPVRPRLLQTILERLWTPATLRVETKVSPTAAGQKSEPGQPLSETGLKALQALEVLREFSAILTHSLCAEAMLKQFLLFLREVIGVNRAAIFLTTPKEGTVRGLKTACAIGLSSGLLEHFEMNFERGIGGVLFRNGKVLRRTSAEAVGDAEIQREFETLGAEVAVPVMDREKLVGVATFDGRITGETLSNEELKLIFQLLEELGLAVKNITLHDQLAANHEMLADILREQSSGCLVVNRDLTIVHENKLARKYFGRRGVTKLEFSDLPETLGKKIYQVLKTGAALAAFRYSPEDEGATGGSYYATIVPIQRDEAALPNAALLMVEDRTQSEQLQQLEIEAANLRLVKTMADRLAHEIGNAMVPISTHQQLLADKYKDAEFRASLDVALADGVKRVGRLVNQMRFLARDGVAHQETFPLAPLIEEAFLEAKKHQPGKSSQLKYDKGKESIVVGGDRAALKHALAEVMLNALQANPADAQIGVKTKATEETKGAESVAGGPGSRDCGNVSIEVEDNGTGFTAETAQKVSEPFFTTRNVGLGLGLTVTQKIIETHHGKLEIVNPSVTHSGLVRIILPGEIKKKF